MSDRWYSHATRPLCYVAHPLGAGPDRERNRAEAARLLGELQKHHPNRVFVGSWITLAETWPEDAEHREAGIAADLALIDHCSSLWLTGPRISNGMQLELDHAKKRGLEIVNRIGVHHGR